MHILFLTDNFPPEGNAPATRTHEHCREWVKAGHRVTVITCAPNFPEGKVFPGYRNRLFQKETMDGIEVRRVITYITANEGFARRTLDYLSFMASGFVGGVFVRKPDVIIATSPQFFCACAGWMLAFLRRKPFVFELRDLWPASITAVGAMKRTLAISLLERLELFLYRRAQLIVSVTHAFKHNLVERGIAEEKIKVIINGVDLDAYSPRKRDAGLACKHNLQSKFVAAYIGTHGMAHALEFLVQAAERLQSRSDIALLFAGGGARLAEVERLVSEKSLANVRVLGRQPKELMPAIWSLCNVSIVHLRNRDLFREVIPSKIFESFAMGLPVLIGIPEGEATNLVESNKAGMVVEPENPKAMADAIVRLADDHRLREELAQAALNAAPCYDRKALAAQMLQELEHVISKTAR